MAGSFRLAAYGGSQLATRWMPDAMRCTPSARCDYDMLSGDGRPDFVDAVHELAHALDVYLIPDVAVPLEGAAGDGAIGNGKLLGDVGQLHAGVGKDRRVRHDILDPLEDRGVGFGACRQAGYTQRVGPAVEHRRAGDGLDVPC